MKYPKDKYCERGSKVTGDVFAVIIMYAFVFVFFYQGFSITASQWVEVGQIGLVMVAMLALMLGTLWVVDWGWPKLTRHVGCAIGYLMWRVGL